MIGWLEGKVIEYFNNGLAKELVLSCGGVGYEVKLLAKHPEIKLSAENYSIWIHQLQREDSTILYGFEKKIERDLFRKLIAVNGIGPKVALSLLDNSSPDELVHSIINQETNNLKRAPGVGKRMAERLIIELKDKLKEFYDSKSFNISTQIPNKDNKSISLLNPLQIELKDTLLSLEYEETEINKTICLIFEQNPIAKQLNQEGSLEWEENFESLLKSALVLLSQDHS
tara:strand:+ start:1504 stop:2187 length:684 start_codon:yes stop_codon:yes gene_type:complete